MARLGKRHFNVIAVLILLFVTAICMTCSFTYAATHDEGMCGTCKWTYDDGVLTIGEGQLPDIDYDNKIIPSWHGYGKTIKLVVFDGDVKTSEVASGLFCYHRNLEEIRNIEKLDMSNTYDITNMFLGDMKLKSIDLSKCKTENVKFAYYLFDWCRSLKHVKLGRFSKENSYATSALVYCDMLETLETQGGYKMEFPVEMKDASGNIYAAETEIPDEPNTYTYTTKTSLAKAEITGLKNCTMTGKAIQQKLVVTLNNKKLEKNVDYTVSYKNNVYPGKATVTVTGIGHYTSKVTASFDIKPSTVKVKSIKPGAYSFQIKWAKKNEKLTGFQIQSEQEDYIRKTKTIKKSSITSYKWGKLYEDLDTLVRIRSFREVGGKRYYSAWTKDKKIRVKHKRLTPKPVKETTIYVSKRNCTFMADIADTNFADKYVVYLRKGKGGWKKIGVQSDNAYSFIYKKSLKWNTTYYIRIKAIDTSYGLKSKFSKPFYFKTPKKSERKSTNKVYKKYNKLIKKAKKRLPALQSKLKKLNKKLQKEEQLATQFVIKRQALLDQLKNIKKTVGEKAEKNLAEYQKLLKELYASNESEKMDEEEKHLMYRYNRTIDDSLDMIEYSALGISGFLSASYYLDEIDPADVTPPQQEYCDLYAEYEDVYGNYTDPRFDDGDPDSVKDDIEEVIDDIDRVKSKIEGYKLTMMYNTSNEF